MAFIDIGGAALRYELSGEGDSTLVLVHEMAGMLESWDHVVEGLRTRHRVLRYDTRGAGLSEKLTGAVTFADMAADLAGLIESLGIAGKVLVAGCAVGAGIALKFALTHPERVAGVVAMAPATGIIPERRPAALALADRIAAEGPRSVVDISFEPSYPVAVRHDLAAYEATRARWLGNDPESFAHIYRMLANSDLPDELAGLSVPSLFLAGTYDGNRTPEVTQRLAAQVAGSRFEAIASGHFMAIQTPALVRERLLAFAGNDLTLL